MFYSNNNYMQDLYAYNQIPQNNTYCPFIGNNNMYRNPNNLYPAIYRIINPVVNRVISGTNTTYLTEDSLNNLVDTVYNIVEGQVELEDTVEMLNQTEQINRGQNSTNTTQNNNTTIQRTAEPRTTNIGTQNTTISNNRRQSRNDSLLRDLIKILILKQIFSRNNCMFQTPYYYQNQFDYNQNFMQF